MKIDPYVQREIARYVVTRDGQEYFWADIAYKLDKEHRFVEA